MTTLDEEVIASIIFFIIITIFSVAVTVTLYSFHIWVIVTKMLQDCGACKYRIHHNNVSLYACIYYACNVQWYVCA